MLLRSLGVSRSYKKGEFNTKRIRPNYTVFCFLTPFVYFRDGKLCEGKKGDILINSPNSLIYHGPLPNSDECLCHDWLILYKNRFDELLKKYPLPLDEAFSVGEICIVHEYAKRLQPEFNSEKIGSKDMIDSLITEMVIKTHRAYTDINSFNEPYNNIDVVRGEIIKNPAKKWTLKEMASLGGYSTSRFSELYFKQYGTSPINDVINQRILLAKNLLISGQVTVSHVAEACGFNSINYFSKYFKKATGYTPSEYIYLFG